MSCKCASFDEDECRYYCEVSGSQCMYLTPNSERCAKDYGEGPDADNEEIELEDFHEVEDEEDKEDANINQYDRSKVVENYYRASSALMESIFASGLTLKMASIVFVP